LAASPATTMPKWKKGKQVDKIPIWGDRAAGENSRGRAVGGDGEQGLGTSAMENCVNVPATTANTGKTLARASVFHIWVCVCVVCVKMLACGRAQAVIGGRFAATPNGKLHWL